MFVLLEMRDGVLVDVEVAVTIGCGYDISGELICRAGTPSRTLAGFPREIWRQINPATVRFTTGVPSLVRDSCGVRVRLPMRLAREASQSRLNTPLSPDDDSGEEPAGEGEPPNAARLGSVGVGGQEPHRRDLASVLR